MSERKTTPGPTILPEQVDAALAEYTRWGTGFDSKKPREISHSVIRQDDDFEWVEISTHRSGREAQEDRHIRAMRAALEAAQPEYATILSALKAMDEALKAEWVDPDYGYGEDMIGPAMHEAWIQIRSALSQAKGE